MGMFCKLSDFKLFHILLFVLLLGLAQGCASSRAAKRESAGSSSVTTDTKQGEAAAAGAVPSPGLPEAASEKDKNAEEEAAEISLPRLPAPPVASPSPPHPAGHLAAVIPAKRRTEKPWSIHLTHGSRRAVLDEVLIWLHDPATNGTHVAARATWLDRRTTLDPILDAPTNSLVKARAFRVVIDPGHGGMDPGAQTRDERHNERDYVLDIAERLRTYLSNAGCEVFLTRIDNEETLTLEDRIFLMQNWTPDVFVSIHINSAASSGAQGLETYVMPPPGVRATSQHDVATLSSRSLTNIKKTWPGNAKNGDNLRLAFCVQRRLLRTTDLVDRGLKRARFQVLREASAPAILVEAGFLSNSEDAAFLSKPNGRERIARGIYQGIIDYALGQIGPGYPSPKAFDKPSAAAKVSPSPRRRNPLPPPMPKP